MDPGRSLGARRAGSARLRGPAPHRGPPAALREALAHAVRDGARARVLHAARRPDVGALAEPRAVLRDRVRADAAHPGRPRAQAPRGQARRRRADHARRRDRDRGRAATSTCWRWTARSTSCRRSTRARRGWWRCASSAASRSTKRRSRSGSRAPPWSASGRRRAPGSSSASRPPDPVTPERYARLKELVANALDGPGRGARGGARARLRRRRRAPTGGPGAARRARARGGRRLPRGLGGRRAGEDEAPGAGRRIGPYLVEGELGRGGSGVVLRAVRGDDAYRKAVAIKLVPEAGVSDVARQRFLDERQILAGLDHPNIARLLDGGQTDDGLPYLVMELVTGERIDAFCDARRLGVADRVRLFTAVAAAVHHAHRNLVVHRDLKPANVLVTADGVPKLLDFGIARLRDPSGDAVPTVTALRAMTPEYASPEQVRGEPLTVATDVYSLGVLLYELLTGHRPYRVKGEGPAPMLAAVCDQDAQVPSDAVTRREERTDGGRTVTIDPEEVGRVRGLDRGRAEARAAGRPRHHRAEGAAQGADRTLRLGRGVRRRPAALPRGQARARAPAHAHLPRRRSSCAATRARSRAWCSPRWRSSAASPPPPGRPGARRCSGSGPSAASATCASWPTRSCSRCTTRWRSLPGSTGVRELLVKRGLEYLDGLSRESADDPTLQLELAHAYKRVADVQGGVFASNLGDTPGRPRQLPQGGGPAGDGGRRPRRAPRRWPTRCARSPPSRRMVGRKDEARAHAERALAESRALVGRCPGRRAPPTREIAQSLFAVGFAAYHARRPGRLRARAARGDGAARAARRAGSRRRCACQASLAGGHWSLAGTLWGLRRHREAAAEYLHAQALLEAGAADGRPATWPRGACSPTPTSRWARSGRSEDDPRAAGGDREGPRAAPRRRATPTRATPTRGGTGSPRRATWRSALADIGAHRRSAAPRGPRPAPASRRCWRRTRATCRRACWPPSAWGAGDRRPRRRGRRADASRAARSRSARRAREAVAILRALARRGRAHRAGAEAARSLRERCLADDRQLAARAAR